MTYESNQYLLKYSDDSTLISLMSNSDVDGLVGWCDESHLIINTDKVLPLVI